MFTLKYKNSFYKYSLSQSGLFLLFFRIYLLTVNTTFQRFIRYYKDLPQVFKCHWKAQCDSSGQILTKLRFGNAICEPYQMKFTKWTRLQSVFTLETSKRHKHMCFSYMLQRKTH